MTVLNPSEGPYELTSTPDLKHGKLRQYHIATQMCLAHNMQIRSLNAIYIQATSISSLNDIADFLVYCQCWYETLEHHHQVEEEFFFPELEKRLAKPGLMEQNVEQHKVFHKKLDTWGKKCYELRSEDYDGVVWRGMIEDFAAPLLRHLHDEIETMKGLAEYDPSGVVMLELWKELDERTVAEANKWRSFPFALGAIDVNFEGGIHHFPNVPFFVPYMVDWIYGRRHRGSWRFSPSDMHGQPRPLRFVESES